MGHRDFTRIDVLHISLPCQFWSGARVNPGQNDEANQAALYACEGLLSKLRPRVFLMEQTYGLLQSRYSEYFNKLIQSFTAEGYSVQWRNRVEFVQYGLPQNRKRLMIMRCWGVNASLARRDSRGWRWPWSAVLRHRSASHWSSSTT